MVYFKNLIILCVPLFMCCALQNNDGRSLNQGVYGNIYWLQGNMMPSPDEPRATNGGPIERKVNIYEAATFKDVTGQAPLFTKVNTKLVKSVKSDSKGFYECELPTGRYSIFTVEEKEGFFANSFNNKEEINIVEIKEREKVKLDISINYKAAY